MMKNGRFCAHRGVSALMPENTLPAFAAALALGADEIEFDVRMTKDGKMVVSHDGTLCSVAVGGFVTLKCSGTAPAVGFAKLCADGAGGVKAGGEKEYLVVAADGGNVTFML